MRRFYLRLIVAAPTFTIGITGASVWALRRFGFIQQNSVTKLQSHTTQTNKGLSDLFPIKQNDKWGYIDKYAADSHAEFIESWQMKG